ncbi:protein FAM228A isoform X1 [Pygocentrus nattereri]|uniref:Protein FAM228B n=1 Tax=Pygocentrus nattereri TaxID=42514 RepID=A0A3B4DS10_PYGNA|nr:protein FAM228A isoform X1 [Pygocentrus nattereri]
MTQVQENDQAVQGRWTAQLVEKSSANLWGMPFKVRKGCDSGVIFLHKPVPPHLLQATSPRGVWPRSLSVGRTDRRYQFIRSATQRPTRVVTQSKTTADMPRTLSPCSITQLQEQLLSEQQEADAITQPLLDTENGFIKDLELYLDHRDSAALRKRELLHRRWTQCVWQPIQRSVEQHFARCCCEAAEPMRMMLEHYINYGNAKGFVSLETYDPQEYEPFLLHLSRPHSFQVSTLPLKDPLSLQARARMNEKRTILRCQTGQANECQRQEEGRDGSCLQRASRVSRGTVDLATAEGRSFQPECWSSTGPS